MWEWRAKANGRANDPHMRGADNCPNVGAAEFGDAADCHDGSSYSCHGATGSNFFLRNCVHYFQPEVPQQQQQQLQLQQMQPQQQQQQQIHVKQQQVAALGSGQQVFILQRRLSFSPCLCITGWWRWGHCTEHGGSKRSCQGSDETSVRSCPYIM